MLALMVRGTFGALGVQYERPRDFYSPDEAATSPLLNDDHPKVMKPRSTLFFDTTIINFEKRQISFERQDSLGFTLGSDHYAELGDYLRDRRHRAVERAWYLNSQFAMNSSASQEQNKALKLAWEMPVQYPGWAQRVLGNDPPRLTITGSLRIKMAYEDIKRKQSEATQEQTAAPGFNFEQVNQFNITGSVGRLINLNISANSEDGVSADNPLKKMKIDYQESKSGELEDEVVQQVSAGYMGFSMPGTQLSGYSESKEGLFGIKVTSKFGPLTLTGIASTEQGETQKLSISNNGKAAAGNTTPKGEDQFIQDRYFFLDTAYIPWYNKKYAVNGGNSLVTLPDSMVIDKNNFQVWVEIEARDQTLVLQNDGHRQYESINIDSPKIASASFLLLRPDQDYHLYPNEGYIRFYDSAQIKTDKRIGIYMRTNKPSSLDKGGDTITPDGKKPRPGWLWLLKSENSVTESMERNPDRFRLMWRNVYEIPGDAKDIAGFVLRIFSFQTGETDTTYFVGPDKKYLTEVMGLAKGKTLLTEREDIFDFQNRQLIIPPYNTSAYGNEPFSNPELGKELVDTMIYRFGSTDSRMLNYKSTFTIEMSGTSKQKVFNLDIGVMENTVIVKADGSRLEKNIDYSLNTEIGSLELTSPRALTAEKIDIEYQREALFVPERKVFLGMRGEMQLPFISDKSFMGLSILYQGTSISQPIPRINQEPFQKLLFDFNTKIDLKPEWMNKAVNAIPLVKTDAQSSVTTEFEVAHSRMNPNTENQAYVDDFESAKQPYQLGESYRNWYTASPPWEFDGNPDSSILRNPPVWDQYWFTPVNRDNVNRVWRDSMWRPNPNELRTGSDAYETVLRLHVKPSPDSALSGRYHNTWAGIMTPIPASMADRKRDQYFELMVKVGNKSGPTGRGRLHIQMGKMREDICISGRPPNGFANHEDTSRIWRDNTSPALDKGLDTLVDEKEKWFIPLDSARGWDSLSDSRLGEWKNDPAKDRWQLYDEEHWQTYKYACRLEKDGYATATEDINMDGTVDFSTREQYHEFIIDLADTNSPYIDQTAKSKIVDSTWHRYRLPLHEIVQYVNTIRREVNFDASQADDWHNIRTVRLIWDGFDPDSLETESQLILSTMQFVGNQWETLRDSLGKSKIDVSVIGTRESREYETSIGPLVTAVPARIARQKDDRNVYQPEQSLRLNFHNIGPGQSQFAQRSFVYQKLDLASYQELGLEVHGMDTINKIASGILFNGEAQFVVRFGNDTNTYYEYRQKINAGWNNQIRINLKRISELKLRMLTENLGDTTITSDDGSLYIRTQKGKQPSFSNIIWMAMGVVRDTRSTDSTMLNSLELWVDELKVIGIKKFNGWSSRLNLSTQWADFLTLSGDFTYQGGDFRTMTDNALTMGDSKLTSSFNLQTGLDKFMPKEWGVAIPVGASVNMSLTRPQLMPSTDVYLTDKNGNPDGFIEMVKSVMIGPSKPGDSGTAAEHFETRSFSERFFVNYSKTNTSTNPAVDLLLQRLSSEFAYSMSANASNRGERPNNAGDFANTDSSRSYTGGVRYNLTPRDPPLWTKWRPLDSVRAKWVPQRFKELELTFLPKNASLNLANASFTHTIEQRFDPQTPQTRRDTRNFTINHGLQLDFTPISPIMDLSYSLTVNREFPDSLIGNVGSASFMDKHIFARNGNTTWKDYYILDRERSRAQRFKLTFNPQLVDWLTNSADYSANYDGSVTKWGNDNSRDYLNAKVNSGVTFNSSLTIATLLKTDDSVGSLSKMIRGAKKGCDFIGFNNVNFTYSMTSDLTNNYLGPEYLQSNGIDVGQFTAYQLGIKDRSFSDILLGNMNDRQAFGGMRYRLKDNPNDRYDFYKNDNRTVNWNCAVSTGLGITKPIDLQLSSISLRWSKRYALTPDTNYFDKSTSFPEFSVGARSSVLDKITLLAKYAQGMNLSSNFSYKQGKIKSSGSAGEAVTKGYDLSPLISVDGTVKKWPVRFNYQHTVGHDERKQETDATVTNRNGDNMEMSYEIPPPAEVKTIKLLKWSFPIKGKTSMAMAFTRDWSRTVTRNSITAENSNLSVKPNIAYDFTTNVTGRVEYTGSRTTEMGGAITTSNIFGIVAEIRF